MTITRATLTTLLTAALASACASTPAATSTTATTAAAAPGCMMPDICPMQVEGTTVTEADVDGGASLVFVTTGDVVALRDRVVKMAAMHASHASGGGKMAGGMHHDMKAGGGMSPGMKMGMGAMGPMPAASASAANSEGGATLTLTATDPATLGALREHVRARATHMQSGACAMKPAA